MSQINTFPIATRTVDFQKVIDAEGFSQDAEAARDLALTYRDAAQGFASSASASASSASASASSASASASSAETARTQAELAATAAGATLYDSTASGLSDTTDSDVFLVSTEPGVQVYRNDTGSATLLGWLGEVLLDDAPAFFDYPGTLAAGTYVRTRAEGFAYRAVDMGGHVTNAGGQPFEVLTTASGYHNMAAWGVRFDGTSSTSHNNTALANMAAKIPSGTKIFIPYDGVAYKSAYFNATITWTQLNLTFEGVSQGTPGNRDLPDMFCSALVYTGTTGKGFLHEPESGATYQLRNLSLINWRLVSLSGDWAFHTKASFVSANKFMVLVDAAGGKGFWNQGGFGTDLPGIYVFMSPGGVHERSAGSIGVKMSLLRSATDPKQLAGIYDITSGSTAKGFQFGWAFGNDDFTDDVEMQNIEFSGQAKSNTVGVLLQRGVESANLENGYYEGNINTDIRVLKGARGVRISRNFMNGANLTNASIQIGQGGGAAELRYFHDITVEHNFHWNLPAGTAMVTLAADADRAFSSGVRIIGGKAIDCNTAAIGIDGSNMQAVDLIQNFEPDNVVPYNFITGVPLRIQDSVTYSRNTNEQTITGALVLGGAGLLDPAPVQVITPSGGNQSLQLPDETVNIGKTFVIKNADATNSLLIRNSAFTFLDTLTPNQSMFVVLSASGVLLYPIMHRLSSVTAPSGGTTVDTEARAAVNALISRLTSAGVLDA